MGRVNEGFTGILENFPVLALEIVHIAIDFPDFVLVDGRFLDDSVYVFGHDEIIL